MTTNEVASAVQSDLDRLLQSNGIRPGHAQRRRLGWLVQRFGAAMLRTGDTIPARDGGVIIVAEPPTGPGAELLYRAMHAGHAVVIPFGENPAFDFLKSKLTEFGTVGPSAGFPHEMWWGGVNWSTLQSGANAAVQPRVISCYPRELGDDHAKRLRRSLEEFQLDFDIEPIETHSSEEMLGFEKTGFILKMWRRHRVPLLFVEADAVLHEPPLLPANLGCDVALHKWNRWEMSARTLYFGRSDAAEALLCNWHHLATSHPTIWEGYLLDQAWSLTSSQMPIDTVWLPRAYHSLTGEVARRQATIVHNLPVTTTDLGPDPGFASLVRGARRAGRTGARDTLIILRSEVPSEQGITVILRDVAISDVRTVAARIEAVTRAFAADPGGFAQLELSLCSWQEDVRAATLAANMVKQRIVEITPWQTLPDDLFRTLAQSRRAT
jgi:hypothetical protein